MNRQFGKRAFLRQEAFLCDYRSRINPQLMNELLYQAVPVLAHTGWRVTRVGFGVAETLLPLNDATTNQHGTHQAALISLSADYTGGMALTTLLTGVPLSGIHRCEPEIAASLWLAQMDVKYLHPSTGHLTGKCEIDEATANKIRDRYFQGKRVLVSLPIEFFSNDQLVAKAELKYFAQPTKQLLERKGKASALFTQKIKASARMIAGVRAMGSDRPTVTRIDRKHDSVAAGPHGALLASRLQQALPQLSEMVRARTEHIDQTIAQMPGLKQVVLLGAGLDMRPFRLARPDVRYLEIDLPEMLDERERVIAKLEPSVQNNAPNRHSIPADFLTDDVAAKIQSLTAFDADQPTLIVYEGCSMYFQLAENTELLTSVWKLLSNAESKIWCDFVSESVVNGETEQPEVLEFLGKMAELGESFIFGVDSPAGFLKMVGCRSAGSEDCQQFLGHNDNVLSVYHFAIGSAK